MFRLFRIGKLIRPLRVLGQFRPAWLLVRGMLRCIFTVLTTFLLIFLFLFIYGCLVLELIAKDPLRETDPSYDSLIGMYFPDLYTTLVSLSHFITLDVELDASFKRAMPILENKIPQEYHASCKSILRVCAFTYVIGSLTTILNVRNIWLLFRAVMFRR